MYVIEALHPAGWREQGRARFEYWAYQEAQARCCSDGRNYRILDGDSGRIMALVSTSSCKAQLPRPAIANVSQKDLSQEQRTPASS